MLDVKTERVLVVPTERFRQLGYFQGFSADAGLYLAELLDSEHVSFRPRGEVEEDPSFKQLIPYVIFRHRSPSGDRLFHYVRGAGQGEGRLHRKRSVGIGGHISSEDVNGETADPYLVGMRREIEEEIFIDTPYTQQFMGLINDDETPVGQVHLGVVHIFDVQQPHVRSRESDIAQGQFGPVEELLADLSGFESWSQICLTALFK